MFGFSIKGELSFPGTQFIGPNFSIHPENLESPDLMNTRFLKKLTRIYDSTLDVGMFLAGVIFVFMMLSVCAEVVLRYFLNRPSIWVIEISGYILVYMCFLVAAWVLKKEGHVKVDFVIGKLSLKNQSLVNAITSFINAIASFFLSWFAAKACLSSLQLGERTPTPLMIPKSYVMVVVFVGGFLLFIQCVRRGLNYLMSWRGLRNSA